MEHQALINYFMSKTGASESYPFGDDIRVFKVAGKMFGLISESDDPLKINLKCDPDEAMALRDVFESVAAGYHMNKKHWNTITMEGDVPEGEVKRMIDNSYDLVVASLTRKLRDSLR
ncbi:MmcQ/YjbR family DNA-binding protein [Aliikangiella coralliicola]|uniref:MmcQ/YjbR family DNA-binding protein n=1 Tax=Aliikangiella coralliicola TaxID=2592383 RepID=A0A545UD18_9GAMM|nr:MmcQ/YjbR family DNA-binding protein [Aliikangiella coralliicola]TQV87351.1 MmcQ/YjbR family DNA-binding protein [Aliikangiella coralliicola]